MNMDGFQTASFWHLYGGYIIIAVQILLLIAIILVGYFFIQRRNRMLLEEKALRFPPSTNQSLQELVDQANRKKLRVPLDVALSKGSYVLDKELKITSPVRITGLGVNETRVVAKGSQTAMEVTDVKNCSVANLTIEGKIQCNNSNLQIENCQIIANEDGICIEAQDGSTVTVSGLIRGEGGIAIRACGESKVILKQPYVISGEDYIVIDPKSSVTVLPDNPEVAPNSGHSPQPIS